MRKHVSLSYIGLYKGPVLLYTKFFLPPVQFFRKKTRIIARPKKTRTNYRRPIHLRNWSPVLFMARPFIRGSIENIAC